MGRKSTVDKLPRQARRIVERAAVDPAATLDSTHAQLAGLSPAVAVPSRSAIHRWLQRSKAVADRVKASREAARVLVTELGEVPDGDQGRAIVQIMESLVHQVMIQSAEKVTDDDALDMKLNELLQLARIVRQTTESGNMALRNAERVDAAVRAKLIREQREKLDALGKTGAVSPEALALVMKAAYDL